MYTKVSDICTSHPTPPRLLFLPFASLNCRHAFETSQYLNMHAAVSPVYNNRILYAGISHQNRHKAVSCADVCGSEDAYLQDVQEARDTLYIRK